MLNINLQGEEILLLADRALYWARHKTLIISDLHWGKVGQLRGESIIKHAITDKKNNAGFCPALCVDNRPCIYRK